MPAQKRTKKRKASLDIILSTVEGGFVAVAEDIADIKSTMATKDDVAAIIGELADIKQRLKDVETAVEDHAGHSKEIDHALERIAAIEKHLGLDKKIVA